MNRAQSMYLRRLPYAPILTMADIWPDLDDQDPPLLYPFVHDAYCLEDRGWVGARHTAGLLTREVHWSAGHLVLISMGL